MQMLGVCVSHETIKGTMRRREKKMGDRQNTCDMKDGEGTEASRVKVVGIRTVQQDIYENGTKNLLPLIMIIIN